jgi:hypothetical protein
LKIIGTKKKELFKALEVSYTAQMVGLAWVYFDLLLLKIPQVMPGPGQTLRQLAHNVGEGVGT